MDDYDDFDDDFDDDFGDDLDDFDDEAEDETEDSFDDAEIEIAGAADGEFDGGHDAPLYSQYGASVDLDKLTDEQRDLYDNAYHSGHDAAEQWEE